MNPLKENKSELVLEGFCFVFLKEEIAYIHKKAPLAPLFFKKRGLGGFCVCTPV
jgi:hypothetical protein